jgi:hypothetical protein
MQKEREQAHVTLTRRAGRFGSQMERVMVAQLQYQSQETEVMSQAGCSCLKLQDIQREADTPSQGQAWSHNNGQLHYLILEAAFVKVLQGSLREELSGCTHTKLNLVHVVRGFKVHMPLP